MEPIKRYRRTDLYQTIAGNDALMPEAAGVDLDIACDDMKDELETLIYKLTEGVLLASFICLMHLAFAISQGIVVCIPCAVLFSSIIVVYTRKILRLKEMSEATTHIITERQNVPPYSLATGVFWF